MLKPNNSISAVITAYNSQKYIAEAIESVIAQTCPPDEIIVIDDGSTDETRCIVETFITVRYIYQKNSGASAARNAGVASAGCEIICFLDADDLWLPEKLMKQKTVMESDSAIDMVFTHAQNFYSKELDNEDRKSIRAPMEPMPGHIPSAFCIRKNAFALIGPFDTSLKMGEFIDWYGRAKEYSLCEKMIPEVLVRRRLHTENQGVYKRPKAHQDYLKIIREKIKRSRNIVNKQN